MNDVLTIFLWTFGRKNLKKVIKSAGYGGKIQTCLQLPVVIFAARCLKFSCTGTNFGGACSSRFREALGGGGGSYWS